MCVMVPQKYNSMNFYEGYNHASLRLSRYAYYTVMYAAFQNVNAKIMTGYGLA